MTAFVLAATEHLHDRLVFDPVRGLGLIPEFADELRVLGTLRLEDLQGDRLPERIPRLVNDPAIPFTDFLDHGIAGNAFAEFRQGS
jgi:hypothetical protein